MQQSFKILIVEDEAIIAMALAAELEDAGHKIVEVAHTGNEALDIITSQPVDLVILDIKLGDGMDGLQTLEKIRKIDDPYVFVVSGNSDAPTAQRIAALGVERFFVKPVSPSLLLESIETLPQNNKKD